MPAPLCSLADALRRLDDSQLTSLLRRRRDLARPAPTSFGALTARATSPASVRRALQGLTRPELSVAEALAVLPDPTSVTEVAAAVGAEPETVHPVLDRLRLLALVWGEDAELHAVRSLAEVLPAPAGLAPEDPADPTEEQARTLLEEPDPSLAPLLERLAWGAARVDAGPESSTAARVRAAGLISERHGNLVIPRPVHLALRGGRVRESLEADGPELSGPPISERFAGGRTAQAVEAALEAVRILDALADWGDDAPGVLRRGGIPQRDLRRAAQRAEAPLEVFATVLATAWADGLVGHDGATWQVTDDYALVAERDPAGRWSELVAAWMSSSHVATLAGSGDASGAPRALLSSATAVPRARGHREWALALLAAAPGMSIDADALADALAWYVPLVPAATLRQESHAVLVEGRALGLIQDGALTELGLAAASASASATSAAEADEQLAAALRALIPAPVDEVLLDADLTAMIPGRPSQRLEELRAWTEPVSRGGALTLRFTPAAVRRALAEGRDVDALRALLADTSRTPIPQSLDYLLADESRRHGHVRVGRALAHLVSEEHLLTRLEESEHAAGLGLLRLAPTVAVAQADATAVLAAVRRAGLAGIAVGADGSTAPGSAAGGSRASSAAMRARRGREAAEELERAEPDLAEADAAPGEAARAIAQLRRADQHGAADLSVPDTLLEAISQRSPLRLGIVDGRGGIIRREAIPLSLDGGRLRARTVRGDEEFTVLVHRVTIER